MDLDRKKEIFDLVKRIFNKPPRDPARIPRILELLRVHWERYPDQRLTQIIGNCFGQGDHYYKEDSDLEVALKALNERIERSKEEI